jgi:hypothetical protein
MNGDYWEDPGVDERIILKWLVERLFAGSFWLRIGTGGGLF